MGHPKSRCFNKTPPDNPTQRPQEGNNDSVVAPHEEVTLAQCFYVVLDLETTGFSRSNNNAIEIAAVCLSHDGISIEDGAYTSLICPPGPIPTIITELTGISQVMVRGKKDFQCVIVKFFKFIEDRIHFVEESTSCKIVMFCRTQWILF